MFGKKKLQQALDQVAAWQSAAQYWQERVEVYEGHLEAADARIIELAAALTEISNMRTPSCAHIGKRMADVADRVVVK